VARVCLLVVAAGIVDGTALLVGANRDELLERPTTLMTVLRAEGPRVLGGRDEHSGGTWLAVNQHGVFGALTNQPLGDAKDLTRRSRGELPLALTAAATADEGVAHLLAHYRPADYNGAWLVVGDRHSTYYVDFTGLVEPEAIALGPGLHVLENAPFGSRSTKATRVRHLLAELPTDRAGATAALQRALADHWVPEPAEPAAADARPVVPSCVHLEHYGTRSSCLVQVPDEAEALPQLSVADGPPCTAPFVDVSATWSAAS
jgi:uncharacterized protein with NRDE domain